MINKIKNKNIFISIFSDFNLKPSEANELWSMGVDSVFIDDPSKFNIF